LHPHGSRKLRTAKHTHKIHRCELWAAWLCEKASLRIILRPRLAFLDLADPRAAHPLERGHLLHVALLPTRSAEKQEGGLGRV
jgi:hypothetical protein